MLKVRKTCWATSARRLKRATNRLARKQLRRSKSQRETGMATTWSPFFFCAYLLFRLRTFVFGDGLHWLVVEIVLHRQLEIEELVASGVVDAGDLNARSCERIVHAFKVKE